MFHVYCLPDQDGKEQTNSLFQSFTNWITHTFNIFQSWPPTPCPKTNIRISTVCPSLLVVHHFVPHRVFQLHPGMRLIRQPIPGFFHGVREQRGQIVRLVVCCPGHAPHEAHLGQKWLVCRKYPEKCWASWDTINQCFFREILPNKRNERMMTYYTTNINKYWIVRYVPLCQKVSCLAVPWHWAWTSIPMELEGDPQHNCSKTIESKLCHICLNERNPNSPSYHLLLQALFDDTSRSETLTYIANILPFCVGLKHLKAG